MAVEVGEVRRYQFGPLEKRGVLAGLRAGQLAMIATAFVLAFGFLTVAKTAGLPFALVTLAGGAGLVWVQPGGRGFDEWAPIMMKWALGSLGKKNQWFSTLPLLGNVETKGHPRPPLELDEGEDNGESDGKKGFKGLFKSAPKTKSLNDLPMPPPFAGLTILEVPVGDGPATIGVIRDDRNGLYTGVLAVRGDTFALLEQSEKERRLQSWADVLGSMARPSSFVHRVQWIERAVPDDGDALNRYLIEAKVQPDSAPTVRSYIDLLEQFGAVSQQHETYVAVQINAVKSGRLVKKAGGGDKGACLVLIRELRHLADSLHAADIHVEGALSPRLLALTFRNAVDPHNRRMLVKKARLDPENAGVAPKNAWPLATETAWDHFRTEDVFHATFWISEWPRLGVGTDFLSPLMVRTQRIRTVALVMQPVDPVKAQREIESAHTAYVSDEELRNKAGYMPTARRDRELEGVQRREQELADGFAEYRFAGYVTVTASSLEELDEACAEIEQASQQARLELRRLYGEQDVAFSCTLPLCRGLN